MYLYQYLVFIVGTIPVSESTQESTASSDNDDANEKPSVRPVEEQSETNT